MRRLFVIAALLGALGITGAALAAGNPDHREDPGPRASPTATRSTSTSPATSSSPRRRSPGASFGWHSHRAAVAAVVKSGTLTLYDSADPSCTPQRYSAGQGFVEQRNHVHLARNEGNKRVVVLVTYLGLKHGVNPDVPAESPGNCPF